MQGLMQEVPLSIPMIIRRARYLYPEKQVISRRPDRTISRATYGEVIARAGRLAHALKELGLEPGARVATLAWNNQRHLEAYFAIPSAGFVLHTLNLRLHPTDLSYIIGHAEDQVVLVDHVLWPLWEKVAPHASVKHVIVMSDGGETPAGALDYEALLNNTSDEPFTFDALDERSPAAMCYTACRGV